MVQPSVSEEKLVQSSVSEEKLVQPSVSEGKLRTLIGIQPAERERRKAKNRQLRDSNPGCLTKAAINH